MGRLHDAAKIVLLAAVAAGGLWSLSAFAFTLSTLHLDRVDPRTAGCVSIFTGRHDRVLAGIERFATGTVPHMLIAGTTQGTNRAERNEMVARAPRYFDCCAEFESESRDTLENAKVTAAWARRLGCTRVTVVTDDDHLTRALSAMRASGAGLSVRGHAIRHVRSGKLGFRESAGLIISEFHKFLAAQVIQRRAAAYAGTPT